MIRNEYTGTANDLRKGDLVLTPETAWRFGGEVSYVEPKAKWTTVHFTSGNKARVELFSPVTYTRLEKTEDELAEDRRQYTIERLRKMLSTNLADTTAELVRAALAKHDEHGYNIFSWSNLPEMLKAQAKQNLFLRIDRSRSVMVEKGIDEDTALLAAFSKLSEYADRSRMQDPLSRSTSVMSNILDDLEAYSISELERELGYYASRTAIADAAAAAEAFFAANDTDK